MRVEPAIPAAAAIPLRRDAELPVEGVSAQHSDYVVLSNAAYRALVTVPRLEAALIGAFALTLGGADGQVRVSPGASPGTLHVTVEVQQLPSWPPTAAPLKRMRLEADLRSTWVAQATGSAPDAPSAVRTLAEAMFDLAQLPGQHTVSVDAEPHEHLWPAGGPGESGS